jgi:Cft2 family RNA processing exonuclease
VKLIFLGGADEVGASGMLVEIGGRKLLVDCGIRPSPRARWGLAGDQLPDLSLIESFGRLEAILVTHAHTDHTGALELVTERFKEVPVYATRPTAALTRVLHYDSRRIMQSRLDEEGELPLFDDVAVERLLGAFQLVDFQMPVALGGNVTATFYPAGHIAGAAMIGLASDEGRLLITGDLSISPQRTVDGARPPAFDPDVLVIESTYGGRLHANRAVQERLLVKTVAEIVEGGGKVLIPAFALGRAQELLLILGEFQRRGDLSSVPVWADGMVRAICQAYSNFPDYLPLPFQERGAQFYNQQIRPVESRAQRNAIVWEPGPAVIVSSSGMLAGGPAVEYARVLASQPQHAILLTGYQDEEAPGRRLQELAERGRGAIRLGKNKVDVQCHLGTYSLSAHADEAQLISLCETLSPSEVVLVHGDESARASLARALGERKRRVHLPYAGQTVEFRFSKRPEYRKGIGRRRDLDVASLWRETGFPAGGFFTLEELAEAWWGDAVAEKLIALKEALDGDCLYYSPDPLHPGSYRAHTSQLVELHLERRERLVELGDISGQWLLLRGAGNQPRLAFCQDVFADHFLVVEEDNDAPQPAWPEDIIVMLGVEKPPPDVLERYGYAFEKDEFAAMEPNQALAFAKAQFPPEARLRKVGYRLAERVLTLTFDFPDVAWERYADILSALQETTRWDLEVSPQANQNALSALARKVLPEGCQIIKGPSIYLEQKRLEVTVAIPAGSDESDRELQNSRSTFLAASGYKLVLTIVEPAAAPVTASLPVPTGERMEINAAYAVIQSALAGSTLYRTSLIGDKIVLAFISPHVGERYRAQFDELSKETGWPLEISPKSNQGAIIEAAQSLVSQAGWTISKGPSIYLEKGELAVTLIETPGEPEIAQMMGSFEGQTGFRLTINTPDSEPVGGGYRKTTEQVIEIPIKNIQLHSYHRNMALNSEKLLKAVERARRMGINPPIQVRRTRDGYLLMDGLYRLKAAESLGLISIPAYVE